MSQAQATQATGVSTRRLAIRGSLVEGGGYASAQVLRLFSNLVLSRLLFPEAFGLTALVSIFLMGLSLLSDVGLEPSVIQNERGDEPRFLNTVWTMQIIRGIVLWLAAVALALPAAWIYDEPMLAQLLPVAALSSLLNGFASTYRFTLRRHLRLLPLVILEVGAKIVGVAVMIVWAWRAPSVWALVAGGLVEAAVACIGSHLLRVGYRNRLAWDPETREAVFHFGKWIFGSSAVYFLGRQADRLLLGRLLGMATLGVYSIAGFLSEALSMLINQITHRVFYPVFSRAARQGDDHLRRVYYATRLRLDLLAMPAAGALLMLGQPIVDVLYDERYADAGWMLQILSVRIAMECALGPCETCLFAQGHTRYGFFRSVARTLWVWCTIPLGWWLGGLEGLVWASALAEIPVLLVLWPAFHGYGMLQLRREGIAVLAFAGGVALGALTERFALPFVIPLIHG